MPIFDDERVIAQIIADSRFTAPHEVQVRYAAAVRLRDRAHIAVRTWPGFTPGPARQARSSPKR